MTTQEIEKIIIDTISEYNSELEKPVDLSTGSSTILFGGGGQLDSIDLVNLIVDVESAIRDASGKSIVLANPKAMSQKNSPFRTVGSLSNYIAEQLGGES